MRQPPGESRRPLPPEGIAPPVPAERIATTTEKGHGRIEKRTLETTAILTVGQKAQVLSLLRNHWKIENCLHYVRDVTLGEDACRVRTGSAPQVLAAVRNTVIHLLSDVEAKTCPEAIEIQQIDPEQARELIGIPQNK